MALVVGADTATVVGDRDVQFVGNGHRNGQLCCPRVKAPRVNDKRVDPDSGERQRFSSAILPGWARKSPQMTEVLPLLCLHGLSTSDFGPALERFLGSGAGLSASAITSPSAGLRIGICLHADDLVCSGSQQVGSVEISARSGQVPSEWCAALAGVIGVLGQPVVLV